MADWLNISSGSDSEDESNNHENPVFEFENAPYLTAFDDGYDPNEDPDFEDPDGLDDSKYDTEDETDDEFELDDDAFDDTQICYKGNNDGPDWLWASLGPCDHMCCKVWHLKPMELGTFMKHHGNRCTVNKCKNPNAAGILFEAILLAKPSKIFCPTHDEIEVTNETVRNKLETTTVQLIAHN